MAATATLSAHSADQLHPIAEAASTLRVTTGTLRHWCLTGRVNHYRIGKQIMVAQSDLEAFLRSSRVEATK
jgi:excisionase family DNA binding protein